MISATISVQKSYVLFLWKEIWICDGQQFHQYQENEQSSLSVWLPFVLCYFNIYLLYLCIMYQRYQKWLIGVLENLQYGFGKVWSRNRNLLIKFCFQFSFVISDIIFNLLYSQPQVEEVELYMSMESFISSTIGYIRST